MKLTRGRPRALFLDAAITHTKVLSLNHDGDALGREVLLYGARDLRREFFLHL